MSYAPDDWGNVIPPLPRSLLLATALLALACAVASLVVADYLDAAVLGGSAILLAVGGLLSRE